MVQGPGARFRAWGSVQGPGAWFRAQVLGSGARAWFGAQVLGSGPGAWFRAQVLGSGARAWFRAQVLGSGPRCLGEQWGALPSTSEVRNLEAISGSASPPFSLLLPSPSAVLLGVRSYRLSALNK